MADNINTVNHRWIREILPHPRLAVDATCGSGNDTFFLAGLAEQVIAMDIQPEAVRRTRQRTAGFHNVQVLCLDHARMREAISTPADLIVFNLGYLPHSDSTVITLPETTLKALTSAISLLNSSGLLAVACYRGHPGGDEEWQAVYNWIAQLNNGWTVREYTDGRPLAPILYHLRRTVI